MLILLHTKDPYAAACSRSSQKATTDLASLLKRKYIHVMLQSDSRVRLLVNLVRGLQVGTLNTM